MTCTHIALGRRNIVDPGTYHAMQCAPDVAIYIREQKHEAIPEYRGFITFTNEFNNETDYQIITPNCDDYSNPRMIDLRTWLADHIACYLHSLNVS